jgi:catechol 2,3-dioxygenase-like lactoylglutathione lyase family enzyme
MGAIARVHSVVLECPDPAALAHFYSELTGWSVADSDPEWVTLESPSDQSPSGHGPSGQSPFGEGFRLSFQRAPGYQPPVWPHPASPMQFHIDLAVNDFGPAEEQAIKLGATRLEHQPSPEDFIVYADPAGHPFCLCLLPED